MKFLVDSALSPAVAERLRRAGHDAKGIRIEHTGGVLKALTDREVICWTKEMMLLRNSNVSTYV